MERGWGTMLKTLFLLRHADASAKPEGGSDSERPLSDRGLREAADLEARIARFAAKPNLVLCSSARRAVQSVEGWLGSDTGSAIQVETEAGLYLASGSRLLERLLEVDDEVDSLLIVAHNPGIGILAHELLPVGVRSPAADVIHQGFPPAAIAVFEYDVDRWSAVGPGRGRLVDANTP